MSAAGQRIQMLRDRFAEVLPNRIADVRRAWMRLDANPAAKDVYEEFTRKVHTLGGTAGSYGLTEVAALAVEVELVCGEAPVADADTVSYLGTLIEDIGAAVEAWLLSTPQPTPGAAATARALGVSRR